MSIIHIFLDASTFSSCRKFAIFHYTLWLQETTQDTQLSLTYCAVLICSHIARLAPLILRSSSSANLHASLSSLSSSSRSFRIRAPTIRNSLPSSITTSQAVDLFQKHFKPRFFNFFLQQLTQRFCSILFLVSDYGALQVFCILA